MTFTTETPQTTVGGDQKVKRPSKNITGDNNDSNVNGSKVQKLLLQWQEFTCLAQRLEAQELMLEKYKRKAEDYFRMERYAKELEKLLNNAGSEISVDGNSNEIENKTLKLEVERLLLENKQLKLALDAQSNLVESTDSSHRAPHQANELQTAINEVQQLKRAMKTEQLIRQELVKFGISNRVGWLQKQRTMVYEESLKRSYLL